MSECPGEEPTVSSAVVGPALAAGAVMLFVHAAASALLTVVAATATPGSGAPGGAWEAVLWAAAAMLAAVALRPILRRVGRRVAIGLSAGALAAVVYAAVSLGWAAPGGETPLLWWRLASLPAAGALVAAVTAPREHGAG